MGWTFAVAALGASAITAFFTRWGIRLGRRSGYLLGLKHGMMVNRNYGQEQVFRAKEETRRAARMTMHMIAVRARNDRPWPQPAPRDPVILHRANGNGQR
jgi:hypothetical protein